MVDKPQYNNKYRIFSFLSLINLFTLFLNYPTSFFYICFCYFPQLVFGLPSLLCYLFTIAYIHAYKHNNNNNNNRMSKLDKIRFIMFNTSFTNVSFSAFSSTIYSFGVCVCVLPLKVEEVKERVWWEDFIKYLCCQPAWLPVKVKPIYLVCLLRNTTAMMEWKGFGFWNK